MNWGWIFFELKLIIKWKSPWNWTWLPLNWNWIDIEFQHYIDCYIQHVNSHGTLVLVRSWRPSGSNLRVKRWWSSFLSMPSLVFVSLYSFPVIGTTENQVRLVYCYVITSHEEWCAVAFCFNSMSFTFAIGTFPILKLRGSQHRYSLSLPQSTLILFSQNFESWAQILNEYGSRSY